MTWWCVRWTLRPFQLFQDKISEIGRILLILHGQRDGICEQLSDRVQGKKKRWAQGNQILPTLISNVSMAKKIELLTMRVNLPSRRLCRRMPTRSTVAPCVFRWNWTFSQWLPCYLQVIIEKKNSCEIGPIRSAKRKSLQYSLSILLTAQTHGISGRCWRISWYQLARFL